MQMQLQLRKTRLGPAKLVPLQCKYLPIYTVEFGHMEKLHSGQVFVIYMTVLCDWIWVILSSEKT